MSAAAPEQRQNGQKLEFEIEGRASEIERIGESVAALASLMGASDPRNTHVNSYGVPLLHGLSHIFETFGTQLLTHSKEITNGAFSLARAGELARADAKHNALMAAAADFARKQA